MRILRSELCPSAARRRFFFHRLGGAIGLALVSLGAGAASLTPGQSATVAQGDGPETWSLEQANLTLLPGSASLQIFASNGSQVTATDSAITSSSTATAAQFTNAFGQITGGTITNLNGAVIGTSALVNGGRPISVIDVFQSTLLGSGRAISVAGGGLVRLHGTSVSAPTSAGSLNGIGVLLAAGSVEVLDGSSVIGAATGIQVTQATQNGGTPGGATVLVDASRVEGSTGHGILVVQGSEPVVSEITLRNGSTLIAGNGILLEVRDAATATFNVESSTLTGNIVNGAAAITHVNLSDNASITGVFDNVTSATLAGGGRWQLAGDSDVGTLTLNNGGTVALGDGTAFNTLTVNGDYVGAGGTLLFNTVLGDDASSSDQLIVGGSTSGQTNVAVNNVGGAGAQTVNGIQLIQVGGASNGVFTLAGRAVGGQYEYFLHQGTVAVPGNGNWYLRSVLPSAPDPCLADPTLPGCTPIVVPPDPDPCVVDPALPQCQPPIPVLRPEPGAYLANQAAATQMFGMRLSDRTGGTARGLSERGAWARVSRNQADYGVIADQLSVNGDTSVLQVGTDLASWGADSRGQFGVMLGGGRANNTVTSRETGYSAKGKVEGQAAGVYASWLQDPAQTTGLYVDAWAQYAQFKNTVQGDALARERYDSDAKTASVEAGYSFKVLDSSTTAMFVEPQLQLSYTDFSADRHVETNGTVIDSSDAGGLTSRVGLRLFGHANSDIGNRVQPFVAVNWIHGADDNSLQFDGERLEGGLPKDRYEAKAGASLQLGQRWTAWGDMGLQKGQGGYRDVAGQIGLRASW
jgi:autotransporter family porin